MGTRVDTSLLKEMQKYGAANIDSCFNCGNCTAICPLSEDASFPRRLIRMSQVGLKDELLASKELWLCYYCGECSDTCPRDADPGEFMAAARRYAISSYDPTGLARMLYKSPILSVIFLVILAVLIGMFMLTMGDPAAPGAGPQFGSLSMPTTPALFEFIPYEFIHNAGIIAGILVLFAMIASVWRMFHSHRKFADPIKKISLQSWINTLWQSLVVETLSQKRYRDDCEKDKPFHRQKWFIHASTMWGFLGLLTATAFDFLLDIIGVKPTGTPMALWNPIRMLGTISGLFLMYGTSISIYRRLCKTEASTNHSLTSDWIFLILMWLSGLTGFFLEIAIYLPKLPPWGYWIFLIHVVVAGEMLILIPFTKFAHAMYRILALYLHAVDKAPEEIAETSTSAA